MASGLVCAPGRAGRFCAAAGPRVESASASSRLRLGTRLACARAIRHDRAPVQRRETPAPRRLPALLSQWPAAAWNVRHLALRAQRPRAFAPGDHRDTEGWLGGRPQPSEEAHSGDLPSMARAAAAFVPGHGGAPETVGWRLWLRRPEKGSCAAVETPEARREPGILSRLPLALIACYQRWISPLLPRACRFEPSCSEYARLAIVKYGALRGSIKAVGRILRCHPFHPGGIDRP